MIAKESQLIPDDRIVARLDGLVRKTSSPRAFAAAGRVLASVVADRGDEPTWAARLADAMVGSLWLVQARSVDETDGAFRVELAAAAAVLGVLRPEHKAACHGAIRVWMGLGLAEPCALLEPGLVAQRTLLALLVDDVGQAACCVKHLGSLELGGAGGSLHDWVVARRQRHGALREAECFENLRLGLTDAPGAARAMVGVLGGIVARERRASYRAARAWIAEPAAEATDPAIRVAV